MCPDTTDLAKYQQEFNNANICGTNGKLLWKRAKDL
jgi:hypothetical protein